MRPSTTSSPGSARAASGPDAVSGCLRGPGTRAFTLVELLLSITILSILMLLVTNVVGVVQKTWARASSKVSEFREARTALDLLTRNLSQATLNVYWQSIDQTGNATATFQTLAQRTGVVASAYVRQSELEFVSGATTNLLPSAGSAADYPGHAVFFQAPLGVTSLAVVPENSGAGSAPVAANTENMVNLLCSRGYFVAWGDDTPFRPDFVNQAGTVPPRSRYRLMEYSPTAETNQIYYDSANPGTNLANRRPITQRARLWYQADLQNLATAQAVAGETLTARGILRPVADNVVCLVLSPQVDAAAAAANPGAVIAPNYEYDSVLTTNPGAQAPRPGRQGTQHMLPPLVRVTMVVLDSASGDKLAESANGSMRQGLGAKIGGLFQNAQNYNSNSSAYRADVAALESFLVGQHLNYRVFTSTVIMKEARWSGT